jgi:hypothetical protein
MPDKPLKHQRFLKIGPLRTYLWYRYSRRRFRDAPKWIAWAVTTAWVITRIVGLVEYWSRRLSLW